MVYEKLTELIKKQFYIVFFEKFKSETSNTYIERYVAKHPLLKPEIIIINDQVQGFKKVKEKHQSLERFPILIEIEYSQDDINENYIESIELYTEIEFKANKGITDTINLANAYAKTISLEKIKRLNTNTDAIYLVHSKIGDMIQEEFFNKDFTENFIPESEVELMLEVNLVSYINFIKILDEILIKGKKLAAIEKL